MDFEWDDAKNRRNRDKHGVGFETVADLDWHSAIIITDSRHDYGETRQRAFGFLAGRLHVAVFTARSGTRRIISLRRANKREEKFYETLKTH